MLPRRPLTRAATYRDNRMSEFDPVNPADEWVTTECERIALSAEDWDVFYNAMINPPQPNEKLKVAARRYRERFGR
jgi:uncharacterized protein (DUF1778 family)